MWHFLGSFTGPAVTRLAPKGAKRSTGGPGQRTTLSLLATPDGKKDGSPFPQKEREHDPPFFYHL